MAVNGWSRTRFGMPHVGVGENVPGPGSVFLSVNADLD